MFSYVSRPEATEQGEYVSAINCLKEIALQQMILTKRQYGKENGYITDFTGAHWKIRLPQYEHFTRLDTLDKRWTPEN